MLWKLVVAIWILGSISCAVFMYHAFKEVKMKVTHNIMDELLKNGNVASEGEISHALCSIMRTGSLIRIFIIFCLFWPIFVPVTFILAQRKEYTREFGRHHQKKQQHHDDISQNRNR
jgi:formate hydrogenlyase subunit 4